MEKKDNQSRLLHQDSHVVQEHSSFVVSFFSYSFSISTFFIFSLFALAVITIFGYFWGYTLITYPLSGNDALNNLTSIVFLDRQFPHIPLWFPYQGGGESITLGYPQLSSYAVILLHRLGGLTFASSIGVINFLSLLLPAWGCYFFVAWRLKSKIGGLFAGLLYFLSPMPYIWIAGAGFLAQTFSVIFLPFYLIFFDWFVDSCLRGKASRLALVLSVLIGLVIFLGHPVTLMGVIIFDLLYALGRTLLWSRNEFWLRAVRVGIGYVFLTGLTLGLCAFWYLPLNAYLGYANRGITATLDTTVFAKIFFSEILELHRGSHLFPEFAIFTAVWVMAVIGSILGIIINRKVTVFGTLAVLSMFFSGSLLAFLVFGHISVTLGTFFTVRPWFPFILILNPIAAGMAPVLLAQLLLWPIVWWGKKTKYLRFVLTSFRYIIEPVLAVFFVAVFLYFLTPFSSYYNPQLGTNLPVGPSIMGMDTREVWNRLNSYKCVASEKNPNPSKLCHNPLYTHYFQMDTFLALCDSYPKDLPVPLVCKGEKQVMVQEKTVVNQKLTTVAKQETVPLGKSDLEDFVRYCKTQDIGNRFVSFYTYYSPCLSLSRTLLDQLRVWPLPVLTYGQDNLAGLVDGYGSLPPIQNQILTGENHRVDLTPYVGTIVKGWSVINHSSMLNAYTGQLSLIKPFYSIFNDAIYDSATTSPVVINNLAKYFGIEALIVNASKSPMNGFAEAKWTRIGGENSTVLPPFKTGLVTIGPLQKILVIGSYDTYKQVFQEAASGAIPFDTGLLVEGPESLGSVSSEELSHYRAVVMIGYKYGNREADLSRLRNYISNGGRVFIDTGWQYLSPDWGMQREGDSFVTDLPEPFPVMRSTWGDVGKDWNTARLADGFSQGVLVAQFGPLTWNDQSWSLASAQELRSGARALLSKGNSILVAGEAIGNGKIVWSGMNLLAHEQQKKSSDEQLFINGLFAYLLDGTTSQLSERAVDFYNTDPEHYVFTLKEPTVSGDSLYFKEAYFPSWKATVIRNGQQSPLAISIAGPGFMVVPLPALSVGDKITFSFTPPFQFYEGVVISIATFGLLLLLLIDGFLLHNKLAMIFIKKIAPFLKLFNRSFIVKIKKAKEDFQKEEDDY